MNKAMTRAHHKAFRQAAALPVKRIARLCAALDQALRARLDSDGYKQLLAHPVGPMTNRIKNPQETGDQETVRQKPAGA